MENYVLYEELSQGNSCTIYKGRRKGSTEYVAVHCIEKWLRPQITNTVRLTHDIVHRNVVQFREWYETSNHLWLVAELCVGGSLQEVMTQDGPLPEKSICNLGGDLVRGLHYLHIAGIIFCDLVPSKVLVDSPGTLKYSDFSLARLEGEDLAAIYAEAVGNSEDGTEDKSKVAPSVMVKYAAPEVLNGKPHSVKSDLWSLGIVLYEMFVGGLPNSVSNRGGIILSDSGPLFSNDGIQASAHFQDLVHGLLTRDPHRRFNWDIVLSHPFWDGSLDDMALEEEEEEDVRREPSSATCTSQSCGSGASEPGSMRQDAIASPSSTSFRGSGGGAGTDDGSGRQTPKPRSVGGKDNAEPMLFSLSSRPYTSAFDKGNPASTPLMAVVSPAWLVFQSAATRDDPFWTRIATLLYHASDLTPMPIAENARTQRLYPVQWEAKNLPVPSLSASECQELTTQDFQAHWEKLLDASTSSALRNIPLKKIHILNYMATLAISQSLVNRIVGYDTVKRLVAQLKSPMQTELLVRVTRVICLVASNMTYLEKEANATEVMLAVTEALRAQYRDARQRQWLLMSLGELVFCVARMEFEFQCLLANWTVPSLTVTIINRSDCQQILESHYNTDLVNCVARLRASFDSSILEKDIDLLDINQKLSQTQKCLQEGEDNATNHLAAKIVENVSCVPGRLAQLLAQNDVSQSLWYMFTHTAVEAIRVTAISALCRMTVHSVHVFHAVLEKAGLPGTVEALKSNSVRVQQAMLTMVGAVLATGLHAQKFAQDRELFQRVLRLLESPSTVLRAKVFLILAELSRLNRDVLVAACQARLVMYIERDSRRQTLVDSTARMQWDYMYRCIDVLTATLAEMTPLILGDIIQVLSAVHGRKHPNSTQAKQLRSSLPLLPVILHFISSPVFRPRIVNEVFFVHLGTLLELLNAMEGGENPIDFVCGTNAQENLGSTAMGILEAVSQHPACMDQYCLVVASKILSPLASLIVCHSSDTRLFCLKIFTDIVILYLSKAEINDDSVDRKIIATIHSIITETLLPHIEEFLLDHDPLPSYTLRLLQAVLEQSSTFIQEIEKMGVASLLFQLLRDHHNNPLSNTVQSIVGILACMLSDRAANLEELYDLGLIQHMNKLVQSTSNLCGNGSAAAAAQDTSFLLLLVLDSLLSVLNHVAAVVRHTLQAQKKGEDVDPLEAEHLLVLNKPLAEVAGYLAQLLCHQDVDVQDLTCRLLSLLVQLYGSECHFALLPPNVDCFGQALQAATPKKQKVIIKTLLRLVTADSNLCSPLRDHGPVLVSTLNDLATLSSAPSESSTDVVQPLAAELLKTVENS